MSWFGVSSSHRTNVLVQHLLFQPNQGWFGKAFHRTSSSSSLILQSRASRLWHHCFFNPAYESTQFLLSLIQQRSPVLKGMLLGFSKNFAKFISSIGKKHVVILSGLDSGRRKVIDESSTMQIHYISSVNDDGSDVKCEELGYKKLKEYNPTQNKWKHLSQLAEGNSSPEEILGFEDELLDDDYYASLPFAALFSCCKAEGLNVTCLLCYCSEGDNMPDSFRMAEAACKLLGLSPSEFQGNQEGGWTIPLSWHSVYGPPPDLSMF